MTSPLSEPLPASFNELRVLGAAEYEDEDELRVIVPKKIPIVFVRILLAMVYGGGVFSAHLIGLGETFTLFFAVFGLISAIATLGFFEYVASLDLRQKFYYRLDKKRRELHLSACRDRVFKHGILGFQSIIVIHKNGTKLKLTTLVISNTDTNTCHPVMIEQRMSSVFPWRPPKFSVPPHGQQLADYFNVPCADIDCTDISASERTRLYGL